MTRRWMTGRAARRAAAAPLAVIMAAGSVWLPSNTLTAEASATSNLRQKVVELAGIMWINVANGKVTRGEFAKMLVMASSYRETVGSGSQVSVFADVPREHMYAPYIKIASSQGWMSGYLGGQFQPDAYITLRDGAKAVLALLDYTDEDFSGDQVGGRMAKYHFLDLDEEISCGDEDVLTETDCMNLFYNLLRTEKKDGNAIYGAMFDCELSTDGEINPIAMADDKLKGPKLVSRNRSLSDAVPFDLDDARFFLNGTGSSLNEINQSKKNFDYVVVYYNSAAKTVWAYTDKGDDEDSSYRVVKGTVDAIYYKSADVMTPDSIRLEDGDTYTLETTQAQFACSIYGDIEVGDRVVLVLRINRDSDGEETSSAVIDCLEY